MPEEQRDTGPRPGGQTRRELLDAVDQRRTRIWTLALVRKLTIREIAQVVGVGKRTVDRDLAIVRSRVHNHLKKVGKLEEAVLDAGAEILEETNAVARQAWGDLMEAPKGSPARGRFLRVVLRALEDRVNLLQSLGIVKRVPEEVIISGLEIERRIHQLSDEQATAAIEYFDHLLASAEGAAAADDGGAPGPAALDRAQPVDSD